MKGLKFASDGKKNTITGFNDYGETGIDLVVPELLGGTPPTAVGFGAFRGIDGLRSVVLPDTITSIDGSAFRGCKNLRSVVLSNATQSIASNAFSDCPKLRSITMPSTMHHMDDHAFDNTPEFTDLIITDMRTPPREEPKRFVIACKNWHRRWVYMRACLWYYDFDSSMKKYDNEFNVVRSFDDQFNIAVYRLNDPVQLSEKMRIDYTDAVLNSIPGLINMDDADRLKLAGDAGCILPDRIDDYIEMAGEKNCECMAYLLQYKRDTFGHRDLDFSL